MEQVIYMSTLLDINKNINEWKYYNKILYGSFEFAQIQLL